MTITLTPTRSDSHQEPLLRRTAVLAYGVAVYTLFLATFSYLIAFVLDLPVPHTLNRGSEAAMGRSMPLAILINAGLLGLFGVQHSLMARPFFKRWLTRYVHPAAERPTYCLATCLVLGALYAFWTPIEATVWSVESAWLATSLKWIACMGFGIVFLSSWLLNHFELFGLQQPWLYFRQNPEPMVQFRAPAFYRFVRHPIYTGMLLSMWSTPNMTQGHLLFAGLSTAYILVGSTLEERDLVHSLGGVYRAYQRGVARFLPLPGRSWRV